MTKPLTFEKFIPHKPVYEIYCGMCGDLVYTYSKSTKFCGSQAKKEGCAYKHLLAPYRRLYQKKLTTPDSTEGVCKALEQVDQQVGGALRALGGDTPRSMCEPDKGLHMNPGCGHDKALGNNDT